MASLLNDVKRASGREVIDVDSKCNVDSVVHDEKFAGRVPSV